MISLSCRTFAVFAQTEGAKKGHIKAVGPVQTKSWWIITWQRAPPTCRPGELLIGQFKIYPTMFDYMFW